MLKLIPTNIIRFNGKLVVENKMLKKVDTIRTKINKNDLIKGLIIGWNNLFNKMPTKEQIGVLYSQWALETGEGQSCWNFNLGNIKAVDDPTKVIEYCALNGVWEIIQGKRVVLSPDNPGAWFRSFNNIEDGVFFHLQKMTTRFKSAWSAVDSGNPAAFAHLLKLAYYYTAPEADYVKLINVYFKKYMADSTFENIIKSLQPTTTDSFFDKFSNIFKNNS